MSLTFTDRHIGPRDSQIEEMLKVLNVQTLDELTKQTVPSDILLEEELKLTPAVSESQYLANLKQMVSKNKPFRSLIGMGNYGTGTLPVITRNIFENPCWYTSYTPYQAEISQGSLEALLIFQTMISSLTGFPLSNCSMLSIEERRKYERSLKAYRDYVNQLDFAKNEGRAEGREEGRAEGREEGKTEERAKTICTLRRKGKSDEEIASLLDLDIEDVKSV